MKKLTKKQRQEQLLQLLENDPFITDETLSHEFNVSIQTIRLDRLELNIPELRERIKKVAEKSHDEIRTLPMDDIIGEVIDISLDNMAISILDIKKQHVFSRNNIARGHFLFAQANSLCVALLNDEFALTVSSTVQFQKPVMLGDRVVTKAVLREKKDKRAKIEVLSTVNQTQVFYGEFEMYYNNKGASL
ncbi:transcription factor FapR [Macrococcus armenti]|uniref:transcription factor FapR n=1 Tax=Macrococcus armenti TaxID=2875764 RepID=UPI001CCC15E0|nr:transcription factor FapR [Macrococcus armenti]UBH09522.1 transcription factor FapR [Macrococcus armenti]UBH11800.1 transcription factor FapR [Macrococcus armenti]UBH14016.1 transcription factor FapR [Macrococcus armenti]UBH16275.1 transcription factor FapR [Macrococcus armenti]UBH18633.1 transcription factor FapR [Macrococcus armenti]